MPGQCIAARSTLQTQPRQRPLEPEVGINHGRAAAGSRPTRRLPSPASLPEHAEEEFRPSRCAGWQRSTMLRAGAPQQLISRTLRSHSSDAAALPWKCAGSPTSTSRLRLLRCAGSRTTTSGAAGGRVCEAQNNGTWSRGCGGPCGFKPPFTSIFCETRPASPLRGTDAAMRRSRTSRIMCMCDAVLGADQQRAGTMVHAWCAFCAVRGSEGADWGTHWDCGGQAEPVRWVHTGRSSVCWAHEEHFRDYIDFSPVSFCAAAATASSAPRLPASP